MSAPPPPPHAGGIDGGDSRKRKSDASSDAAPAAREGEPEPKQLRLHDSDDSSGAGGASAAPPLPQPSIMLRCLAAYRDVQFALMQMLELKDLAQLDATCRAWRMWLLHPPLLAGLCYEVEEDWKVMKSMLQSRWLPQLVSSYHHELVGYEGDADESISNASLDMQRADAFLMLNALTDCTRLRELWIRIPSVPYQYVRACFTRLAPALRVLRVHVEGPDMHLLTTVFSELHLLRSLEELEVFAARKSTSSKMSQLVLTALPLLPHLRLFILSRRSVYEDGMDTDTWRCSPAQVQCLIQCRSLTYLDCGRWSPKKQSARKVAKGIGALVCGWLDTPSVASSISSSAASASASVSSVATLTALSLHTTLMTPAVWAHVSRLTTIRQLSPEAWSPELTPAEWNKLVHFKDLIEISIRRPGRGWWQHQDHILSVLLSYTRLTFLSLGCFRLSREQLHAMCTGLPHLLEFRMSYSQLEDCAPLALAPTLWNMEIFECSGLDGSPVQFRIALPAMAHLEELVITDAEEQRLTEDQAAPLNAALFARMPQLTPENYGQNLLDDTDEDLSDDEASDDDDEPAPQQQ